MARNIVATVSPVALHHNLQQVRKRAPSSKIMAMVKANAYGHGLARVSTLLRGADALGVASMEEGLLIRKMGVNTETVLMEGMFREEELAYIQTHRFTQVIHHWPQIQALQYYAGAVIAPFRVWIKINTGMNRLGFAAHEFDEAYSILQGLPHVEVIGMMTHFSEADNQESDQTALQIQRFNEIVGDRSGDRCLANSAGILAWPQAHANWVRPGLMLYGASPFPQTTGQAFDLLPAMSLHSEIIAVQTLRAGDRVGYTGRWSTAQDGVIGIVAMGYGDGYPWHAKDGTPILVNGERAYTAGRVSMDMLAVDLSRLSNPVKVGDPVLLWGEGLPIEEVAEHAATIPYELFCRFTERVTVCYT